MNDFDIYKNIAERTDGDIYIGVVGPVRTGKSTFIKRFMDLLVLPNIDNIHKKERAKDELPQSAAGRTIMTTEPKFVPNEAVEIKLNENAALKVRMVDCVGYLVKGALGYLEGNVPRMVNTPWYEREIPFEEAAELGTRKVITDHSTIGIVVTTDGSITEIPRSDYIEAEERVIKELKEINKPFIILLNSTKPYDDDTINLRDALEEKYEVPVILVDCLNMNEDDIKNILEKILFEFPVSEINIDMPRWAQALEIDHWLIADILNGVKNYISDLYKVRDIKNNLDVFNEIEYLEDVDIKNISLGKGSADIKVSTEEGLFYKVLAEESGYKIEGEHQLIGLLRELAYAKQQYDRLADALGEVKRIGYGVVKPQLEELKLEEPEIVRQGNRFGVRLRASAPSLHIIKADITTEVSPIVGTEKQSEELIRYLLEEFETDTSKIWESNIFGKSLHALVNEGLSNKLQKMPEDAQIKLRETIQRIVNEGDGGLICIIL
ncbi:MAG: stage IV sporulation protein A [Clostridia bacterium]|nr:stage IV sporulation protein A [Clostridia bacterium]